MGLCHFRLKTSEKPGSVCVSYSLNFEEIGMLYSNPGNFGGKEYVRAWVVFMESFPWNIFMLISSINWFLIEKGTRIKVGANFGKVWKRSWGEKLNFMERSFKGYILQEIAGY